MPNCAGDPLSLTPCTKYTLGLRARLHTLPFLVVETPVLVSSCVAEKYKCVCLQWHKYGGEEWEVDRAYKRI